MLPYTLIKKLLFLLPPEASHTLALKSLQYLNAFNLTPIKPRIHEPRSLFGLNFPNPIGLAAGLDKNGEYIDALARLGFGFIEVGTVTPKPQGGNSKPRLFRLIEEEALINRMGFNNKGVHYLLEQLKKTKYKGILGINIGKNKDTPLDHAIDDYLLSFNLVAPFASYVTINVSSPNTPSLRDLQQTDLLLALVKALKSAQQQQNRYVPFLIKIAPDVSRSQLEAMADIFISEKIDGVIATNTTLSREGVQQSRYAEEVGGLSGAPLKQKSTAVIRELQTLLQNRIPIVGCGGISTVQDAKEKMKVGADLLQIYTGFIFKGPTLLQQLCLL